MRSKTNSIFDVRASIEQCIELRTMATEIGELLAKRRQRILDLIGGPSKPSEDTLTIDEKIQNKGVYLALDSIVLAEKEQIAAIKKLNSRIDELYEELRRVS